MDVRTRYTETLSCAAATIGGAERLAQFLNVPRGLCPERRRVRVAVAQSDKP